MNPVVRLKGNVHCYIGTDRIGLSIVALQPAFKSTSEQHWHLGPIGVLPSHRRLGIGSTLMERFREEVDKCSTNAYLETDLDENVYFYRKFGFKVISTSNIFQVENRYMLRDSK